MALRVTDDNDGLESGALTGTGLLLDRLDLHDLVLELGQEEVDNLILLDRQAVQVDLLHALDLAGLDETAQLGDGLPFLLLRLLASTARATTATASVAARSKSTTSSGGATGAGSRCSVSHVV